MRAGVHATCKFVDLDVEPNDHGEPRQERATTSVVDDRCRGRDDRWRLRLQREDERLALEFVENRNPFVGTWQLCP